LSAGQGDAGGFIPPEAIAVTNDDEKNGEDAERMMGPQRSIVFFYERFCDAFPGIRGYQRIDGREAVDRLAVLLQDPLTFGGYEPLWQLWDSGSMPIGRFQDRGGQMVLIDRYRYELEYIAAYRSQAYWRSFVTIRWKADVATGLYPDIDEYAQRKAAASDYCPEEYAVWNGRLIMREQYDDGAVFEGGKSIPTDGARLEVRQLTPGFAFICAQLSALHCPNADRRRDAAVEALMHGQISPEDFSAMAEKLRAHRRDDSHG